MRISFKNDYSEGCHPRILEALTKYNLDQQDGYGLDQYSKRAEELLLEKANAPESKVYLVSGGTQANLVAISSALRPFESVISATTGHIYDNETGAIEATGHKVSCVPGENGKLRPCDVQEILDAHKMQPHQLRQKMVYISNTTEIGTVYNKAELKALYEFCQEKNLYLYMDGARLAQALTAESCDLTLEDVAKYTDMFYVGATKNGALIGEAIVINNPKLQEDFDFFRKQKGALLSKGRLLGIQFQELLRDDLFFDLARHSNEQAMKIKAAFKEIDCDFWADTDTNQIFPILRNTQIAKLQEEYDFYVWRKIDDNRSAIRIITSWATKAENVDTFIASIKALVPNKKLALVV